MLKYLQVIEDEKIVPKTDVIEFKDFQKALDSWLEGAIVKQ